MDDVSFSLGHLYSVSGFFSLAIEDGNDINKRPPMIYYFIIEDLSKHYLQKKLHMPAYVTYNHVRPHSYNGYKTPIEARCA